MSEAFSEQKRYLVRKEGLDYGPYTGEEVVTRFRDDEFDENAIIYDRLEEREDRLKNFEAFEQAVAEYVPVREERRRRKEEAERRFRRRLQTGGKWALILGIIAGLIALGSMLIYLAMQPEPTEISLDKAFVSLDYELLSPPEEFEKLDVNKSLMTQLFDPDASRQKLEKQVSRRLEAADDGESDSGVTEVNFSNKTGDGKRPRLTDQEIESRVLENWDALRGCIVKEIRRDSAFDRLTVKFYIAPSGETGDIEVIEDVSSRLERCVTGQFETMKFGKTGLIGNKGVTYPLYRK
jgi:hypothetical protein